MPRFVVLYHEMPGKAERPSHWDLMLERDGVLLTWAIETELSNESDLVAERLPDHRLKYLEYEGRISGNRGKVAQWDSGDFDWVRRSEDEFTVAFRGRRLHAVATFAAISQCSGEEESQRWKISLRNS